MSPICSVATTLAPPAMAKRQQQFCLPRCLCGLPTAPADTIVAAFGPAMPMTVITSDSELDLKRACWVATLGSLPRPLRIYSTLTYPGSSRTHHYHELEALNLPIDTLLYRAVWDYVHGGRSPVALAFVQDLLDLGVCPNAGRFAAHADDRIVLDIFPDLSMQRDPCRQALLMAGAVPRLHGQHLQWRRWHGRSARKLWVATRVQVW
jgi:hypothetical protein